MHTERNQFGFSTFAKSAFAGLVALALLLAVVFSISPLLHHTLHVGHNANSHLCLACSLAHGQVSAAEVALVSAVLVLGFLIGGGFSDLSPFSAVDYLLSPSRAPPRS